MSSPKGELDDPQEPHSIHRDYQTDGLNRLPTAASVNMTAELFEKLYLSPQNAVKGELRKTFGNPTPMSVHSP
jgi:uncharacterized protein